MGLNVNLFITFIGFSVIHSNLIFILKNRLNYKNSVMCMDVVKCALDLCKTTNIWALQNFSSQRSFHSGVCLEGFAAQFLSAAKAQQNRVRELLQVFWMGIISRMQASVPLTYRQRKRFCCYATGMFHLRLKSLLELSPSSALCFCVLSLTQRKVRQGVLWYSIQWNAFSP